MLSRMSSRRSIGFSEGNGAIPVNPAPQPILPYWFGENIDRPSQNGFEPAREFLDSSEKAETAILRVVREPHNDIDIGIVLRISTRKRSDQGQAQDAHCLEPRFMST